jgi:AraC-like DNA-binding protein
MFGLIIPKSHHKSIEPESNIMDKDLQSIPIRDVVYLNEISDEIDRVMNIEQLFLKSDFKLSHLSSALDIPDHHLASCLRNIKGTTFTDLKNLYRIEAFKRRIESGDLKNLTIDGLIKECGFQSKSSFYSAFQKKEGMTPMEYVSKNSLVYENHT